MRAFGPGSSKPGVASDAEWPASAWGDPVHERPPRGGLSPEGGAAAVVARMMVVEMLMAVVVAATLHSHCCNAQVGWCWAVPLPHRPAQCSGGGRGATAAMARMVAPAASAKSTWLSLPILTAEGPSQRHLGNVRLEPSGPASGCYAWSILRGGVSA